MRLFFAAVAALLLSLSKAAQPASITDEAQFHKFTQSYREAVIKVFLDSTQEAPKEHVHMVKENFGYLARNMKLFVDVLAEFYSVRCWERNPSFHVEKYEVCPVIMDSDSGFAPFLKELDPKDSIGFYFLPPGRFRNMVRSVAQSVLSYEFDLYEHIAAQAPKSKVPFKEALVDVQKIFENKNVLTFLNGKVNWVPFSYRDAGLSYNLSTGECKSYKLSPLQGPSGIMAAVLPENSHKLILNAPDFDPKIDDLPSTYGGVSYDSILDFELLRLTDPISNSTVNVMEALYGNIWELTRLYIESWFRDIRRMHGVCPFDHDAHSVIVRSVLLHNPEALLCRPWCINLKHIDEADDRFAKPFLDTLLDRIMKGTLKPADIDKALLENLIKRVKSEWDQRHYRRMFFDNNTIDESLVGDQNGHQQIGSFPGLTVDIMKKLPFVPAGVSRQFASSPLAASVANFKIFMQVISGQHERSGLKYALHRLRKLKPGLISQKIIEAANLLLSDVLTRREIDEVIIHDFNRKKDPFEVYRFDLLGDQSYVIHSLIFMTGAFNAGKNGKQNPWDAYETIAWLIYPDFVERLRTVRKHLGRTPIIEVLFECPFVDKRWILEQYGVLNDNESDPKSISRLFNPEKEIFKSLVLAVKEGTGGLCHGASTLAFRVVEILEYFVVNGKSALVSSFLKSIILSYNGIFRHKMTVEDVEKVPEFLSKFFNLSHHERESINTRAHGIVARLDSGADSKSSYYDDDSVVQKVTGLLCQREFQRDLHPEHVQSSSRTSPLNRLMYGAVHSRFDVIWIINRCCQLARMPRHFRAFFPADWLNEFLSRLASKITSPHLDLSFKVYCMSVIGMQNDMFKTLLSSAWWHIMEMVHDKHEATQTLLRECKWFGLEMDKDQVLTLLILKRSITEGGLLSMSKTSISHVVSMNKKLTLLYVNDKPILAPSNGNMVHLYGIIHQVLADDYAISTMPFVLVDEVDGKEVKIDSHVQVGKLAYHRLKIKSCSLAHILDLEDVFLSIVNRFHF